MDNVRFQLKAATPMFLGGAEKENHPEFRSQSLKGLLRFWFRAIYPDLLPMEEARLFGSTKGRSAFRLKAGLDPEGRAIEGIKGDQRWNGTKTAYLGYGLINRDSDKKKTITTRPFWESGAEFIVDFQFHSGLRLEDKKRILRSFWALSMFGGLGARSRRGFGSYRITNITMDEDLLKSLPSFIFRNGTEYQNEVLRFIQDMKLPKGKPSFSAFSPDTCLAFTKDYDGYNGDKLLEKIGSVFHEFRSFKSKTRDPVVKNDHDLIRNFLKNKITPTQSPCRAAFGLPHNYFFSSLDYNKKADLNCSIEFGVEGRRASPLLIHVQEFKSNQPKSCALFTFMNAEFLPKGQKIVISDKSLLKPEVDPPDYSLVYTFLKRVIKETSGKGFRCG